MAIGAELFLIKGHARPVGVLRFALDGIRLASDQVTAL